MARAVAPSLKRVVEVARDHLATSAGEPESEEKSGDPIDEEQRELLARFEELERREKE
jgi:hypothetical protein